jgi:hypothetical protein
MHCQVPTASHPHAAIQQEGGSGILPWLWELANNAPIISHGIIALDLTYKRVLGHSYVSKNKNPIDQRQESYKSREK